MKQIYLDNAATTMVAKEVVKEIEPYFTEKYGNASSLHSMGQEAKDALEKSRRIIADKLNADLSEIIFTSSGSESNNLAIKGIAYSQQEKGKHIITSSIEHPSVLSVCKELSKSGFEISYIPVNEEGIIDLDGLKRTIKDDTTLVTIMHANNEIGTIQPIREIGEICREKKIVFHTDAVQSFTKENIDVKQMNIDLLSISSHKIHGPKGIGALYVRKGVKPEKLIHGGHQEFNMRAGTENVSGAVGFAKAVELSCDKEIDEMKNLRDEMINDIEARIPGSRLSGSKEKRLCNNVSFVFKAIEGESIMLHLDMKGIEVSTGSACSSRSLSPSYVLMAIGLPKETAHGSIRFSLSRYTTKEDIACAVDVLEETVAKLRAMSPLWKG